MGEPDVRRATYRDVLDLKTLEVFRLDGETYRLVCTLRDAAPCAVEPFDAFEFELSLLWER